MEELDSFMLSENATAIPKRQQEIWNRCFHPSGTFIEFEEEEVEHSIQNRFERQVLDYPDNLAIKTDDEELTYSQLNRTANRLARAVLERAGGGDEPIVLLFEQGAQAITALLGVLKAGKIIVPLDPSSPHSRTRYMIDDVRAHLILTSSKYFPSANEFAGDGCHVINIDELDSSLSTENLGRSIW